MNQSRKRRFPKEEYDTIADPHNIMQINSPLAKERKMQKEEDEETFGAQNNGDDDELSKQN